MARFYFDAGDALAASHDKINLGVALTKIEEFVAFVASAVRQMRADGANISALKASNPPGAGILNPASPARHLPPSPVSA